MNTKKAQEYFSLYYEGELSAGLLEQFERTLQTDAQVQAEYRAFTQTMDQLKGLAEPIAEPDFDLHEAISRRVDRHFFELDRKPSEQFWNSWRKVLVGSIAALAVVGAVASLWNKGQSNQASPLPIPSSTNGAKRIKTSFDTTRLDLILNGDAWTLNYRASNTETIKLSSMGAPDKQVGLSANDLLESPLSNTGTSVMLVTMHSDKVQNVAFIALPNNEAVAETSTLEGDLSELAKALSTQLGKPVVAVSKEKDAKFSWTSSQLSDVAGAAEIVKALGYSVEQKENGVIWIL